MTTDNARINAMNTVASKSKQDVKEFTHELELLIHKHGMDALLCNTPADIMASYMMKCAAVYAQTIVQTEVWYAAQQQAEKTRELIVPPAIILPH